MAQNSPIEKQAEPGDSPNNDRRVSKSPPASISKQLDIIQAIFPMRFSQGLSSSLSKITTAQPLGVESMALSTFLETLPVPTFCAVLKVIGGLEGYVLAAVDAKLACGLVDGFLGGTDRPASKLNLSEYTKVETTILMVVSEMVSGALGEALGRISPSTEITLERCEDNPIFMTILPASSEVTSLTFEIELENASGAVGIVLPNTLFDRPQLKALPSIDTKESPEKPGAT